VNEGDRVFDVHLQGSAALERFDITAAGAGTQRSVVKVFTGVPIAETLTIELRSEKPHKSLLSGVEVVAE